MGSYLQADTQGSNLLLNEAPLCLAAKKRVLGAISGSWKEKSQNKPNSSFDRHAERSADRTQLKFHFNDSRN